MNTPRAAPALDYVSTADRQALPKLPGVVSSTCPRCSAMFVCGANAASCWCETLAVLDVKRRPEDLLGKGCLCEACLRAAISESAHGESADATRGAEAN